MRVLTRWAGVIYVLTNIVNGMRYIGQTTLEDYRRRWKTHFRIALGRDKPRFYIHRAIRSYGAKNFSAEVIQRCHTLDTLTKAEIRWISKLRTFGPAGYNLTKCGEGTLGLKRGKPSKRTLRLQSISLLAHWADAESRAAHLAALRTPEAAANMSAGQKKRFARA